MMVLIPIRRSSAKRSLIPPLTMSLSWTTPSTLRALGDDERRAALLGDRVDARAHLGGERRRPWRATYASIGVGRALADLAPCPRAVDAAHPRLRGERDERRLERVHVALADAVPLLREDDDAPPLGRLVGERRELRGVGERLVR